MIDEPITLLSSTSQLLRSYHQRRKNGMQISELGQRRINDLIADWKLYRSDKPMTVYTAYGLYEFPVTYMTLQQIDEYVIDDAEYYKLEDFEYTVEPAIMTGREYGELLADW